ncbi:MAG: DUF1624 domain-containing protein [Candidatus Thermoplasmatota archaeon]|nr:DUF1624 domain-containing protein [Candidatus Thermoplasmatota archaeon]
MIAYHIIYDLNFFGIISLSRYKGMFLLSAYPFASVFLLLVGVSLTISYARAHAVMTRQQLAWKFLKRGLFIFGLGMLVTLATWAYLGHGYVVFGVLHCIGLSILLAYPVLRYRIPVLILGVAVILLGIGLRMFTVDFPWLLWLGFVPAAFSSVDYVPLLPYFGIVLLGVFVGNTIYAGGLRQFTLTERSTAPVRGLSYIGRHSLIIYFLHEPLIVGLILLLR